MSYLKPYKSCFFNIFIYLSIFLFVFSPRINIGFLGHTGYIIVGIVFFTNIFSSKEMFIGFKVIFIQLFFAFLAAYHCLMALLYSNNPSYFMGIQISIIVYFMYGFVLTKLMLERSISKSWDTKYIMDKILMYVALSIFANSLIILIEYLFPEIKLLIESILVNEQDANINYADHLFRFRGFSSSGGASLSILNALGVILYIYLVSEKRIGQGIAVFFSLLIVISNIFTGRTGLVFGIIFFIIFLLFVLIRSFKSGNWKIFQLLASLPLFIFFAFFLTNFELDTEAANWAFEWISVFETGKLETSSTGELESMLFIPHDLLHLIFGIGFFEGVGNIYPRSDSGYLKTLFSIGAPFGFFLYVCIVFLFCQLIKVSKKYLWLVVSCMIFIALVEVKEPFFYQNFVARVIFLVSGASVFLTSQKKIFYTHHQ